ncbi:MAG: hypothetical protein ACWA5W_08525 [Phycisphaerales bacterium]
MNRGAIIKLIDQLVGGQVPPVKRFVLMTQLRSQCGVTRPRSTHHRSRLVRWIYKNKSRRIDRRDRIKDACVECGYSLAGIDQIWLNEVCVGPDQCPECGCQYPAVGK